MKHPLLLSLAILFPLCSCNSGVCTIYGISENPEFSADGKYMVLLDHNENILDSCFVENGKFTLSCKKTPKFQYAVVVNDPVDGFDFPSSLPVIPDISRIDVDFDQHQILTEESMSAGYLAFQQDIMKAWMDKETIAMGFIDEGNQAKADSVNARFHEWLKNTCTEKYLANLDNPIGTQAFSLLIDEITPKEAIELFELGGEYTKTESYIVGNIEAMKGSMKTLLTVNEDGTITESVGTLDDYLSKGKPVLVDFWASWCGICMEEMPSIVKIHDEYKDKGLVVVGVTVRDAVEKSKAAMKKSGMTYPQIVGTDDLCEKYGVNGIPHTILFSADGEIIANDVHGEKLLEAITSCMSKF